MDISKEKKWFVYLGNHHEGPFSLEEIQEKLTQGVISKEGFVWAEGMPDWKPMTQVPDFQVLATSLNEDSPPSKTPEPELFNEIEEKTFEKISENLLLTQTISPRDEQNLRSKSSKKSFFRSISKKIKWGILCLTGLSFFYFQEFFETPSSLNQLIELSWPYRLDLLDKTPELAQWISPLPSLDGVSSDEVDLMKLAALEPPGGSGPQIAMGLSRTDILHPTLYVASRLPDKTQFQAYIVGVSDTLLKERSYISQLNISLTHRIGKSSPLYFKNKSPLPKGEYRIYLTSGTPSSPEDETRFNLMKSIPHPQYNDLPKDIKVLAFKTYFLGGIRDAIYTRELNEYHTQLRIEAENEIKELTQFLNTLESQFNASSAKFGILKKIKGSSKKMNWIPFHQEWTKLQKQLDELFNESPPEKNSDRYFYSDLYLMIQKLSQTVQTEHHLHHLYFTEVGDSKAREIQIGDTNLLTQTIISQLKAKLAHLTSLPPLPNGLPQKEEQ